MTQKSVIFFLDWKVKGHYPINQEIKLSIDDPDIFSYFFSPFDLISL